MALAFPFIISCNISCCSRDTGCCDSRPGRVWPLPVCPQEVIGRACGFAENEWSYYYCTPSFFYSGAGAFLLAFTFYISAGFFYFWGTGVPTSLKVRRDEESIWFLSMTSAPLLDCFFCVWNTALLFGLFFTAFYFPSCGFDSKVLKCLRSMWFFS